MLLKQNTLNAIAAGDITLVFRRWKRPTVKTGGTLRTVVGVLAIDAVDVVNENEITDKEARQAGFDSKAALLVELKARKDGDLYRIALHHAGADPRNELRDQSDLSDDEIDDLKTRLTRMDDRSSSGPWTSTTLKLIAENSGKRAPDLAESVGMEAKRFKTNVRKLKELGLTESLKIGYRLSPRGEVFLRGIES